MSMISNRRLHRSTSAVAAAMLGGGMLLMGTSLGCDKQEDIRAYDAPKSSDSTTAPAVAAGAPGDAAGPAAGPAAAAPADAPAAPGEPTWKVPEGWKKAASTSSMRYATFEVSEKNPEVQLTVIPLPPPQPLAENVQRWEGQLGLTPSPADKAKALAKPIDLGDGVTAYVVDLSGPGPKGDGPKQRMLAAIVEVGRRVWFFKLTGADEVVGPQKEKFDTFIRSVRFAKGQ